MPRLKNKAKNLDKLVPLVLSVIRLVHADLNKKHRQDLIHLSPLQIHALGYINERKNSPMKEVADFLSITPSSVTPLIDGLVKQKVLARHENKNDKRQTYLRLTPLGRKMFQRGLKQTFGYMKEIYSCLGDTEQKQMIKIYKKISNYFNKLK